MKAAINWNDWEKGGGSGGGDQLFSYQTNNPLWKMETRRKWKAEKVTSSSFSSCNVSLFTNGSRTCEIKENVHTLGT